MNNPPRDHHQHVCDLYDLMRAAVRQDPDHEPIEVATAAILLALESADRGSKVPANVAVETLLNDLWEIYAKNN